MAASASLDPGARRRHPGTARRSGAPKTLKRITRFLPERGEPVQRRPCPAVRRRVRLPDRRDRDPRRAPNLRNRLAPVANAPVEVVRRLAKDDDIAVAGPVLPQSRRLAEADLVDIARTKSQAHLLAISGRAGIAEPVTDVLVRRGDREVVRKRCGQSRRRGCPKSASPTLVDRAEKDGVLAEKVGLRADIPPRLFRDLLLKATEVVQQRLLAAAQARDAGRNPPRAGKGLRRGRRRRGAARLFAAPSGAVEALRQAGKLDEAALVEFANGRQIRGNRRRAGLAVRGADRGGGPADGRRPARPDPDPLQVGRLGLADREAIIMARPGGQGTSSQGLDTAYCQFRAAVAGDRAARHAVLAGRGRPRRPR